MKFMQMKIGQSSYAFRYDNIVLIEEVKAPGETRVMYDTGHVGMFPLDFEELVHLLATVGIKFMTV